MTQHTPGPWFYHVDRNGRPSVTAGGVERIADCWHTAAGDGNANARLIASAPDLLAALESIFEIVNENECGRNASSRIYECGTYARAAISKATKG